MSSLKNDIEDLLNNPDLLVKPKDTSKNSSRKSSRTSNKLSNNLSSKSR